MSEKLQKGSVYKDFEVIKVFEIKDYHCQAFHLVHKKTGLELLHLFCDDNENGFAFAFRTPNMTGNGAAHIMEHSVLCGSEKYPLKDPFTQLSNQSVNTYLNAGTYKEKTVYPACSIVKADFFNLMNVYADAVFFPRISKEIFMQEAHRVEIDSEGKPSVQGVVYNEMKGNYASFESVANDVPVAALMKGTIYEKDSGGDPVEIINLTYEGFLQFHKKWYRPDNCICYIYGNIPTEEHIDFLTENFMSRLEAKYPDSKNHESNKKEILKEFLEYTKSKPVKEPFFLKATGPSGESKEKGNTVLVTWDLGISQNDMEALEKKFIVGLLIRHDGSPLEKALQESDLGEDTAPETGFSLVNNTLITFGLRGVKKGDTDKVTKLIFDTLSEVVKNGISKEDIDSNLMTLELMHREIKRARGPYAFGMMNQPLNAWAFGRDIESSFALRKSVEILKQRINENHDYLTSLIKKFLLDNNKYVVTEISPTSKYTKAREKAEADYLKDYLNKYSKEKILEENEKLHLYQSSKDDVSCLPHLHPADFIEKGKMITEQNSIATEKLQLKDGSSIDLFTNSLPTNGMSYVTVGFPVDVLSTEELPYLSLFAETVTECGWGNLNWSEAARQTALVTGGINAAVLTSESNTSPEAVEYGKDHLWYGRNWVVFRLRTIDEKLPQGLKLLEDCISKVDFSDLKRISDICVEFRNDMESSVVPHGSGYAALRAQRKTTRTACIDELSNGLSLLYVLNRIINEPMEKAQGVFRSIHTKLRNSGCFISIVAEKETVVSSRLELKKFAENLNLIPLTKPVFAPFEEYIKLSDIEGSVSEGETEIFVVPSSVGFASETIKGTPYGEKMNSVEEVATHWLSNILLWEKIRTIGGAYGAQCYTETLSGKIIFASYRDPFPEKSCQVFEECLKDASEMTFSESEVEKAIMGTFSDFVQPKTPRGKGSSDLIRLLYGISDKERENKVLGILNTTGEELKQCFTNLSKFSSGTKYRVIICGSDNSVSGKRIILPL